VKEGTMIYITYRNVLKPNKNQDDFMNWFKVYWPVQQRWGATSVKFWNSQQDDKNVLFCRYTVESLDRWNQKAVGPESELLVKALGEVVDMDQMSIKITVPSTADVSC